MRKKCICLRRDSQQKINKQNNCKTSRRKKKRKKKKAKKLRYPGGVRVKHAPKSKKKIVPRLLFFCTQAFYTLCLVLPPEFL